MAEEQTRDTWVTPPVLYLLAVSTGCMIALAGTDLGILAAVRELDSVGSLGVVFFFWCSASILGGVVYGSLHTSIRPSYLLMALGLLTIPIGLGDSVWTLSLCVIPAGLLCAPAMTATGEYLVRLVPEARRGEAMGWQGTAFTLGAAVASPVAGAAIDDAGAIGGFAVAGLLAVGIALLALGGQLVTRDRVRATVIPVE